MRKKAFAAVCLSSLFVTLVVAGPMSFRDGDRVCFVGDSITKQGGYHAQILLFYATRFPDIRLKVWNCGIAGDTAAGGIKRYDWDIAPHKPTVLSVMMGMNDVNRGLYSKAEPSETNLTKRRQAIERNTANVEKIVTRATADGARLILITPSLYDQTGKQETPCLFGVNDALKACAEGVRGIAAASSAVEVVEFNPPMAAINAEWQAKDPAFTVVGRDRVHPGAVGHLVMAYLFLKAQGVPGTVAAIGVDTQAKAVLKQENCSITNLSVTDGRIAFDGLANALPFPVTSRNKKALELVPFVEELNQETVTVQGLPDGAYELRVDGQIITKTTAKALTAGINLAVLSNTPQYKQALAVQGLVDKRHRLEKTIRTYALLKQQFFPDLADPTPAKEEEILRSNLAKLEGKTGVWNTYRYKMIQSYLSAKGGKEAVAAECDKLLEQIYDASQPVPHHYELVRTDER